jgi:hypothetical protein
MCSARTQTIHMVKQPFISRFRCDAARTLGFPPFLFDGGGGFRVLYDSHTLRKTMATRKTGTKRPMIIAASRRRVTGEVLVVAKRQDWIPRWRRPRLSLYACGAHDCKWNPRRKHEAAPVATQARGVIRHVLRALLLEATATRSPGLRLDATPCRRFGRRGQRSLLKALRISSRCVLCYFIFPTTLTDAVQPVFCSGACSTLQILDDYAKKMRDAENETHEGKRKAESLWPIMRLSHTRSRYIYELYYKRDAISKELYDWLLKEGYADAKYVAVLGHS